MCRYDIMINKTEVLTQYINSTLVGKFVKIIKVLYFDSTVWYIAQKINDDNYLYMCDFGHNKPSAQLLEQYINNNNHIDVIYPITSDQLPSTTVDIENAIDVLDNFRVIRMSDLSSEVKHNVIDRLQRDIDLHSDNGTKKHNLCVRQESIPKDMIYGSSTLMYNTYVIDKESHVEKEDHKGASVGKKITYNIEDPNTSKSIFTNNNSDKLRLAALYSNTPINQSTYAFYTYVNDPMYTYYHSKEYKEVYERLAKKLYSGSYYNIAVQKNTQTDIHPVIVVRHCIRLGEYNRILLTERKIPEVKDVTGGIGNSTLVSYGAFNNSVEVDTNANYVQCGNSNKNKLQLNSIYVLPNTSDYIPDLHKHASTNYNTSIVTMIDDTSKLPFSNLAFNEYNCITGKLKISSSTTDADIQQGIARKIFNIIKEAQNGNDRIESSVKGKH